MALPKQTLGANGASAKGAFSLKAWDIAPGLGMQKITKR
jgi:hypothetical protein